MATNQWKQSDEAKKNREFLEKQRTIFTIKCVKSFHNSHKFSFDFHLRSVASACCRFAQMLLVQRTPHSVDDSNAKREQRKVKKYEQNEKSTINRTHRIHMRIKKKKNCVFIISPIRTVEINIRHKRILWRHLIFEILTAFNGAQRARSFLFPRRSYHSAHIINGAFCRLYKR